MKAQDLKSIRGICLDIDDTLSTEGKLTAESFASLWKLKQAGVAVVPITGRPAGWCDHIARFWPVDAVIGENGAFTFFMSDGVRRRLDTPAGFSSSVLHTKLGKLGEQILRKFPHAQWASDQAYREFDLAIDFCEDVPPWSEDEVEALLRFCEKAGAHAKLSSIHINTWFGNYDKRSGFEHWLANGSPGWSGKPIPLNQWIFVGDSPNDEPLFGKFRHSVGVANLKKYLPKLKTPPTWITASKSGKGFTEVARELIKR